VRVAAASGFAELVVDVAADPRRLSLVAPEPGARPLDDPRTLALLHRERWIGWSVVLLGIVLFAAFVLLDHHASNATYRLETRGARTAGFVQGVRSVLTRDGQKRKVAVTYFVTGRPLQAWVRLDESSASYRAGQQVTVLYDPARPARMTISGEANLTAITEWLLLHLLVLSILSIPVWLGLAWRRRRWERVLAGARWRAFTYTYADTPRGRGKQAVLEVTASDAPTPGSMLVRVTGLRARMTALRTHEFATVWMAQTRDGAVLATPGPQAIYTAQRPRNHKQRARWSAIALAHRDNVQAQQLPHAASTTPQA